MTEVVPFVYPWDVIGAPRLADELRSLGVSRVVVAAQYHAVMAATPRHPVHQVVDASYSALYTGAPFELDGLEAAAPTWCDPDAFEQAMALLRAEGFAVEAFIAPTHFDVLTAGDEHRVRNAFGHVLRHALCPIDPVVAAFTDQVVDAVLDTAPDGLVVEAISQLGIDHAGTHDKTAGADWGVDHRRLMSLCFCAHCTQAYGAAGGDPAQMQTEIRAVFSADATRTAADLRAALEPLMRAARGPALRARWARTVQAAKRQGVASVSLHASADEWATGPSAPAAMLTDGVAFGASAFVAHCWAPTNASVVEVATLAGIAGDQAAVGAYVTVLPPEPVDASVLADKWNALIGAGATELHLYHLGLASAPRLDAAREALRRVTQH